MLTTEVSAVPASEPATKKRARKRKLNDDGDRSLVRNKTGSKVKPEMSLNESVSSEPVKKRARKAPNKK